MDNLPPEQTGPVPSPLPPRPLPVRMHWGWLLLLDVVTRGSFGVIWMLVQANWVRKVRGRSRAFVWAIVYVCFFPIVFLGGYLVGLWISAVGADSPFADTLQTVYSGFVYIAALVLYYGTIYTLRSELEDSPIGIPLGGGMTFLFGTIYFQYHLRDFEWETSSSPSGSTFGLI